MKNKILLLLGLTGLAVVSAFTIQLTNASFAKNEQKVNFKSQSLNSDLAATLAENTDIKNGNCILF